MGKLSTHVLDTAHGRPAAGMRIDLQTPRGDGWDTVKSVTTNTNGRTDEPLLSGSALKTGAYQLVFHVGDYFAAQQSPDGGKFLTHVPVAFTIADAAADYHVPLLVSPWSYSTYRGS